MTNIEFTMEPEIDTIVGKPLEVEDRIFYPIIQISILKNNKREIIGSWIVPVAIVIEEDSDRYVLPLTDENIDFDELANQRFFHAIKNQ